MVRRRHRQSEYFDHLAKVPLFSQCSTAELKSLAKRTTDIVVRAGAVLVKERQGGYEFFVVVAGAADVERGGQTVAELTGGDFFGELALLDRALRDATVTARTDMELIVLGQWEFEEALSEAPGMTRRLLSGMARRLRQLDQGA